MHSIAKIECLEIRAPQSNPDDCDGAGETAILRVTAADGTFGLGETDAPPSVIAALLAAPTAHVWSMGVADLLLGQNPIEVDALWERMYEGTIYHGRRGLGIMLLSALDIALHDLRGKLLGLPVHELLGGAVRPRVTPYATLFPGMPQGRSWPEMRRASLEILHRALEVGYRAVKVEMLYYDVVGDPQIVEFTKECRRAIGDDIPFMIDFGYRWKNWKEALWTLDRIADTRPFFIETPVHSDDLEGLRRLAERTSVPIAVGEFLQTRHECREAMERGGCDVIQPDIGRVGGLTEALRVARMAAEWGRICLPHAWKTGLTVAATRHFGAAVANCPFVEIFDPRFFPSMLRAELAGPEPELQDGTWPLPTEPGVGVSLNGEVVERCLAKPITTICL